MVIIGITGTIGAGKGTIVNYLISKKSFSHYSVREFLIKEIILKGLPVNRDSMVIVANDLRNKFSPSYIIEQLYNEAIKNQNNCIIESIRNVGEAEFLKKSCSFYLFAVDANPEIRYNRILKRKSETDKISFVEFLENERREMFTSDPNSQNISECMKLADFTFKNDDTPDELYKQVEDTLKTIHYEH